MFTTVVSTTKHYFHIEFISTRCSNNLKESIKSQLILIWPKENWKTLRHQKCYQQKKISETNSFPSRLILISKVFQGTHHKEDILYGTTAGVECMFISFMGDCWSLIKTISRWDGNDLDWILGKCDEFLKSLNKLEITWSWGFRNRKRDL